MVPNISENFKNATYLKISYEGLIRSIPFVYFAFLYQPCIPIIYRELNERNYFRMGKVIKRGSGIAVFLYILACTFGYLGLVSHPDYIQILISKSNILEINYGNWAFTIAVMWIMLAIFGVTPFWILPAKDTYEELFSSNAKMSGKENVIVTLIMAIIWYGLAVSIPGIGDAITILGWTTNPLIGFILPVVFYLKIVPNIKFYKKVIWWCILIMTILISIIGFALFIKDKITS